MAFVALIVVLLLVDLLVVNRKAHVIKLREAAITSTIWVSIGLAFTFVMWSAYGGEAAGEYIGAYLIEKSLSVDNVFVWAVILTHFKVEAQYQHRVLFWGIFGALVMRLGFIMAGVAVIEKFDFALVLFGLFLVWTAWGLIKEGDEEFDPESSRAMKVFHRIVPSTDKPDGQKLFTKVNGKRLATPLFAVIVLIELTDVLFAVDSVPAVLGVSREQFIAFSSNAMAILGLRALYFLLAGLREKFTYLQQGLAVILAFVGVKMLIAHWYHIPIAVSLLVIVGILATSIAASLRSLRVKNNG